MAKMKKSIKEKVDADPITTSVILHKLLSTSREMGITMNRTARSAVFSEGSDFSCGIFGKDGGLVAQAEFIPILVLAASFALKGVMNYFKDDIHDGDVMLSNDPYWGGNHLPDVTCMRPVFWKGDLVYWTVNRAHHVDIGGMSPGSYSPRAYEIYQEGLRISPVKIHEKGKPREDVINLILNNVRFPKEQLGDLKAQMGSLDVGAKRLLELIEKYGIRKMQASENAIQDMAERVTRDAIMKIPEGTYVGEDFMDNDGWQKTEIKIAAAIEVKRDRMIIDFSGSDKQVKGFVNSPYSNTCSAAYVAVMTALNLDIPVSEGCFRPVTVVAPEGTVTNPLPPAPSGIATLSPAETIIHACWKALSKAIPKQTPAGWYKWLGGVSTGRDPRTNELGAYLRLSLLGGTGAMWGMDGKNYICSIIGLGGVFVPDIEMVETQYPNTVLLQQLRQDSGGPGKWRGGLGCAWKDRMEAETVEFVIYGDGKDVPPYGLQDGKPGAPNLPYFIIDGKRVESDTKGVITLNKNDVCEYYTSGGGGYGNPFERDPEIVKLDVMNEYVSLKSAAEDYGVVLNPETFEIDYEATEKIRKRMH